MNDFDFKADLPEPYRIFGLTLQPLSIGRYRRLARHDVAFVAAGSATAELGDLILGVIICSMRCAAFDQLILSPDFKREIRAWARSAIPQPWPDGVARHLPMFVLVWNHFFGRRWRAKHAVSLPEKFALFKNYIAEAQKLPPVRCKQAAERVMKTHWVDNLELVLREKLNWTNEEINEEPITKALAHYFHWADANDLIISDEDIAIAEKNSAGIVAALKRFNDLAVGPPIQPQGGQNNSGSPSGSAAIGRRANGCPYPHEKGGPLENFEIERGDASCPA